MLISITPEEIYLTFVDIPLLTFVDIPLLDGVSQIVARHMYTHRTMAWLFGLLNSYWDFLLWSKLQQVYSPAPTTHCCRVLRLLHCD